MSRSKSLAILSGVAIAAAFLAAAMPQARAANIITFDENANSCGGSVMCSTSTGPLPTGTQGYLNNGSGTAFNLSTITQWFQIDADGVSHLPNQPAEPDGGAGGYLVVNNTGSTVTSFSLTLTDTFTSSTASVAPCTGLETGNPVGCDQFQANKGAAAPGGATEVLSGPDIDSCSTAALVGTTCNSSGSNAVAEFAPNMVTYTWNGLDIAEGSTFDISFASWNNAAFATVPAPLIGHGLFVLLAVGGVLFGGKFWENLKKRHLHAV